MPASSFTAAQAAQKVDAHLRFRQGQFTAAQAAQKACRFSVAGTRWFTAAQAAQAAVFDSDTVPGTLVLIAPEVVNGSTVRMTVEPRKDGGVDVHILTNAYDAPGFTPFARWLRDGLARYVDQKEFPGVLERSGLRLPSSAFQNKPGTTRILTEKSLAIEEVRTGSGRLAMTSIRKYPAAKNATEAIRTVLLNVRNDGGEPIVVWPADAGNDAPKASRGATGSGMDPAKVSRIADAIRKAWSNGPEVVVVADMNDARIPERVRKENARQRSGGAAGNPEGFFYGGKVYLVARLADVRPSRTTSPSPA